MRRAILALFVTAILALAVWALRPRPVPVGIAVLSPRTIEVTVEDEGRAEVRDVFRVSVPIAGRLYRIDLHAGDPVLAGETVVAPIGPVPSILPDARSRAVAAESLAAAEAAVDFAQAQVAQAEATHAFRVNGADRAAVSRHVLDLAVLERATALAASESAQAKLAVRERDSAAAVLHGANREAATCCVERPAPVSWRVLRVVTQDDQVVASGTPILEIGDPGDLRVRADLLSRDAVQVRQGGRPRGSSAGAARNCPPKSSACSPVPSRARPRSGSRRSAWRCCCA
ncbi:MAG: HlyD family efflux transporter periplasmic adaptor subunit [Rhodobacteraceae bacterium]|nr:HlyD family efflux transporter periplasmic adaptor subunit [Paracoccaceae bacterium]